MGKFQVYYNTYLQKKLHKISVWSLYNVHMGKKENFCCYSPRYYGTIVIIMYPFEKGYRKEDLI